MIGKLKILFFSGKLFVAPLTTATADNTVIPATMLNFSKSKGDHTQGKSLCKCHTLTGSESGREEEKNGSFFCKNDKREYCQVSKKKFIGSWKGGKGGSIALFLKILAGSVNALF
jgi:hypothetical protein